MSLSPSAGSVTASDSQKTIVMGGGTRHSRAMSVSGAGAGGRALRLRNHNHLLSQLVRV